ILHEMSHMWFGDLVTMSWWSDLWLNESFATYASVLAQVEATRWKNAWTTFANAEKAWAYAQDQLPSTHPIVADIRDLEDVEVNFDGITYAKGASVLKQLVAWVGRENFLEGVRQYFKQHAWSNTRLADLLTALEQTSGRDLSGWSAEWLETAGVNTLRPQFVTDDQGKIISFAVLQEASINYPTLRSHRIAIGFYQRHEGSLLRSDRLELDIAGACSQVPQLLGRQQPDLILLNDDDLSYTKIRLDETSLKTLSSAIGEFADSLPRTLCWGAAWDMIRDAELPAREYLSLVLSGIGRESDIGVVQSLQQRAITTLDLFADPNYRIEGRRQLGAAAVEFLHAAAPGSDHQLAWARTLATLAADQAHLEIVRGLLEGSEIIEGLTIDADLRWALLLALMANGEADEAAITAELKRDSTAAGERQAAACRAARPSLVAKEEAWSSVVLHEELPNAMVTAVIGGFVQPNQRELLAHFAERYFSVIPEVWEKRTNKAAQKIVVGLYPGLLVEQSTVDRTDTFLNDAHPMPALRRLILEGRDGIARALRAQACDRTAAQPATLRG
ncbi:MAG: aminopeptidase N, partial [Candidatus Dormibacteraceae bacterium]